MLAIMHPHEAADSDSFFSTGEDSGNDHHIGFGEDSRPEATQDFDWGELAYRLGEADEAKFTHGYAQWLRLQQLAEGLARWTYQSPSHTNTDGIAIRTIVQNWFLIKELQPLSLTQLARMYGKDKQSLGRWVDDFKRRFPGLRNCHMKE
jgi:hypothetical protein